MNPLMTIIINNKKTATGATAAAILLSFAVLASAGNARGRDRQRREKYVAKQHDTLAEDPLPCLGADKASRASCLCHTTPLNAARGQSQRPPGKSRGSSPGHGQRGHESRASNG